MYVHVCVHVYVCLPVYLCVCVCVFAPSKQRPCELPKPIMNERDGCTEEREGQPQAGKEGATDGKDGSGDCEIVLGRFGENVRTSASPTCDMWR